MTRSLGLRVEDRPHNDVFGEALVRACRAAQIRRTRGSGNGRLEPSYPVDLDALDYEIQRGAQRFVLAI
jgi:hypothetical protein